MMTETKDMKIGYNATVFQFTVTQADLSILKNDS